MFGYRSIGLTEAPRPEAIRRHPRAPWLALGVVCFGAFMGQLDASIVTLTFRPMMAEFHAPLAAVQWVSLAYLLTLVALLAPVGRMSDAHGRKLIYIHGFVVFTLASVACGLAPALGILVIFRLIQAAGAAMLQANSVALVTTSVPRSAMRRALGIQAAAQAAGLALGPTLGGLLTASVGWRFVYWVNVPVGLLAVMAGRYLLPRTRQFSRVGGFDWPGAVLLALSTTGMLLALSGIAGLATPGWADAALALVAVAGAVAFAVRELRARSPVIPVALLRRGQLALALAGAMAGYLLLFGPLVLIPQLLAGAAGTEGGVGLMLSALPAGFGVAALSAEAVLPRRLGNRERGMLGASVCVLALGLLVVVPLSAAWVVTLLALTGLGLGAYIPANNTVIMRSAPAGSSAMLGGLVNMARGIGTTLGIALMTLSLHLASGTAVAAAQRAGSRLAFAVLTAVAVAATSTALARNRPVGNRPAGNDGGGPGEEGAAGAFS